MAETSPTQPPMLPMNISAREASGRMLFFIRSLDRGVEPVTASAADTIEAQFALPGSTQVVIGTG